MAAPSGASVSEKRQASSRAGMVPLQAIRFRKAATPIASAGINASAARKKMALIAPGGIVMAAAPAKAANTSTSVSAATSARRDSLPIEERCGSRSKSLPGATTSKPMLSCGHARTQSRQNVQSRFPNLRGRWRWVSQPRCCSLPRRQSCVRQLTHTSGARAFTSRGETTELMK